MDCRALQSSLALAFSLVAMGFLSCGPSGRRPSVILISIDSLRRDGLSSFGNPRPTSPNLDRLAQDGTKFLGAVSTTTWTLPAHHALLRGLYDDVHGARRDDFDPRTLRGTSLPERFRRQGYLTGGCFSAFYLHPFFGFQEGFAQYRQCYRYRDQSDPALAQLDEAELDRAIAEMERQSHQESTSAEVEKQAGELLQAWRKTPDQPFFLFLHFYDVHYDYVPPRPFDSRFQSRSRDLPVHGFLENDAIRAQMPREDLEFYRGLYDGEIGWVDDRIGRLLARLSPDDDVIVAVVSDHGDEFFEHGSKGHRRNLYGETLDIPMLFWSSKERVPRGVNVSSRVRLIDVAATLLELCGLPVEDAHADATMPIGESLVALMREPQSEPRGRSAFAELDFRGRKRALLDGDLKLIGSVPESGAPVQFELYDLARDPGEQHDLFGTGDPRQEEIGERYDAMLASVSAIAIAGTVATRTLTRAQQATGYVADRSKLPELAALRYRARR